MQADLLRKKFLDFFKSKKHKVVESDTLVPKDDPTVLFTPAGMNQFKKEFLGFDSGFKRAATSQRCLRTDDLVKVGKTPCHHTFFEMLGNFSFGDYFKKEAISWAWEFLTEGLKIDKDKLWVSVYKDDDEAYEIWKNTIGVPANKIVKLGDKENFWPSEAKAKGPNGPCGPCSEIFFDFGKDKGCGKPDCSPACDCDRFTEAWNLVFTQFNRKEGGVLEPLPNKNIDTGMGLERLAAVMQGKTNNFETDLFVPIINEIAAGQKKGLIPKGAVPEKGLVYAIADHIRAIAFSIYDGVLPSNEARGYVVRKVIRKSTLHLKALGFTHPFLYKLVPVLAEVMREPYPDLGKRQEEIAQIILAEEKNFINTLNSSEKLFKEKFHAYKEKQNPDAVGKIAFELYDTFGIPFELTQEWLLKNNVKISIDAFNKEMTGQKTRSKQQSAMKGDVFAAGGRDYGVKATSFSGYKGYSGKGKVLKILKGNTEAKKISAGEEAVIILDKTPFYGESGGQVGDTGEIVKGKNIFTVLDTRMTGSVILHKGIVKSGNFKKSDSVSANVDVERRLSIARNHTATHLLQAALRKVLGAHVQQQGSLVAEDRLRFDFTHFKGLSKEEQYRVEEIVNDSIIKNYKVEKKEMTLAQAKKSGALAFFGEKYESKVRVLTIDDLSKELCGGTHIDSTGQIGLFKILQEGSVASGVRRIEATTGAFAYKKVKEEEAMVDEITAMLNVPSDKVIQELERKASRLKELEKALSSKMMDNLKDSIDSLIQGAEEVKGMKVITKVFQNLDMDLLRKNVDLIKEKTGNAVIALGSNNQGRVLLVLGVTQDLCLKGLDAVKLIRQIGGIVGGSGGGRADFAQAGGNKPEALTQAFKELRNIL